MSITSPEEQNISKLDTNNTQENPSNNETSQEVPKTPEQEQAEFIQSSQEVEKQSADFKNETSSMVESAISSLEGTTEDKDELEELLKPVAEEEQVIRDEHLEEISDLAPNSIREGWADNARKSILSAGIKIDENTDPYKSFGDSERFFIQKCFDQEGNTVVAKISAPDESSRRKVQREAGIYDLLHNSVEEAGSKGETVSIKFPQKLQSISNEEAEGVVTSFVEDDKEAKNSLRAEEKIELVSQVISEMHKLPIPQEELSKSYKERDVDILTANEYKRRWDYQIPGLVESGSITKKEGDTLLELMDSNQELIDSFDLKLDHGDVHGGNIAYSKNNETGEASVTLMDLEALKITNPFSGVAQIANREVIANKLPEYKEIIKTMPNIEAQAKEAFDLMKHGGISKKLEQDIVEGSDRPEEARKVYNIMRLNETIETLYYTQGEQETPANIKKEIYLGVFKDLIEKMKND